MMAHRCLEELLEFLIVLNDFRPVRSEESTSICSRPLILMCVCDLNEVQIMIQLCFVTEFNDDYDCDLNLLELELTYAIECAQVLT